MESAKCGEGIGIRQRGNGIQVYFTTGDRSRGAVEEGGPIAQPALAERRFAGGGEDRRGRIGVHQRESGHLYRTTKTLAQGE